MQIPFSRIPLSGNEIKYVEEVLKSGWLTTASKAVLFEDRFAELVKAKFACAVNSCTAALHLGIEALGVRPGDKVFVQSMTFTATVEIIRYMQADPVFLDVEYGTNLITLSILTEAIEKHPEVRFLVIVHYGGQAADMPEIIKLCAANDIKILEDAAHAFPSKLNGQYVGSFGNITCFSFYANKTITTGEGGMMVTNDEVSFKRVKTMRLHGINHDIWDRFTSDIPIWEYDVVAVGHKYNMPDVNAAIGLAQLEQADIFRKERQKVAEHYYRNLSDLDMIDLPVCHVSPEDHAWHLFPVVLNKEAKISRNSFIEKMSKAGIGTSVHYKPLHRMTYYMQKYQLYPEDFPNTEKTWKGNVSLPLFPFMKEDEMEYVCETMNKILS
jgi:dTDP-4-amino-4,6-dideoxygalactose transaminase